MSIGCAPGKIWSMLAARFCIAVVLVTAPLGAWQSGALWTDAGNKNGITLAFRDDPQLDAREVRAVAELPHPAGRISSVVCDFSRPLDPGVREARVLSGAIGTRYEIYLRYAPQYVVVSARDVVIDVRHSDRGCDWSEVADRVPSAPGAVRMPLLRGSWAIDAIDPSRSRVTYRIAVKPGGSVPGWMVRRGALSALTDVISRVSRCLADPATGDGRCSPPRD